MITGGVYRISRNPQNVGWGLVLFGMSLVGASGTGLLLGALFWLAYRFYMPAEEKHLEHIFGDEYRDYRQRTPRYFGIPKSTWQ